MDTAIRPSRRISTLKPYFFAELNDRLLELRAGGIDVIRLDMGSPDLPPAPEIVEALVQGARRDDAHGYTPYGGTVEFRQAVSEYYARRFGVDLDPRREVVGLIGSKEGIYNLSQALLDPGDVVLVPNPAYPTYAESAYLAGAEVYELPLLAESGYLPDLGAIPEEVARRARLLWLNYPNNPTGACAGLPFFRRAIEFANQYELVLVHDAPYMDVSFDGYRPPSLLQVPGAQGVAVELNSLSKSYNMAGWRLGMAVGNPEVLRHLYALKVKVDSSHYGPIQQAGAAALTGDQGWLSERNARYQERRDIVVATLREAGLALEVPRAALYVWAALSAGEDEVAYCHQLVSETGVSVTPGTVFGSRGAGYIRISLCTPTDRLREAMERLRGWVRRRGPVKQT